MKKNNTIILGLILSIIAVASITTYAWFTWSSPNDTNLILTIGELADVKFEEGNDINVENIGPVLNYLNDGEITTFSFRNKAEVELYANISLNITNLPNELKEESFKYVLLSSSDNNNFNEVASGNFKDKSNGPIPILENDLASVGTTYFKFIIYIDGNMENPISMMGQSFSATLEVSVGEKPSVADSIINLSEGDTWEPNASGVFATNPYTDESTGETKYHDYRYIGANVNNYVKFNNDMYRIIGVFDDNSHGVVDSEGNGEYLVKLISANLLSANSYGAYNSSNTSGTYSDYGNDWTGGTTGVKTNLNILLNDYFYNKTDTSSTYGNCSTWTYYYNNTNYRTNDCSDIVGYGIDPSLQNYIEDATWYLFGYSDNSLSKQNFYLCERGQYDGCTSANSGAYATSTTAKIGLMYVSDYMYASGYFNSTSTEAGSSFYYGNQNWLYKGYEWTITPCSNNLSNAFYVDNYGFVNTNNGRASYGYGARPAFYLTSNVYIAGGNGTFDNPYTLILK